MNYWKRSLINSNFVCLAEAESLKETIAAYESAWNYLKLGINCLSADSWQSQYDLTLALYVEAAEAAILSGSFEEMERLASVVLQQGKTLLDKVNVYEVKIQGYTAHNKPLEAVKTALSVLTMLGIRFPKKPTFFAIPLPSSCAVTGGEWRSRYTTWSRLFQN